MICEGILIKHCLVARCNINRAVNLFEAEHSVKFIGEEIGARGENNGVGARCGVISVNI